MRGAFRACLLGTSQSHQNNRVVCGVVRSRLYASVRACWARPNRIKITESCVWQEGISSEESTVLLNSIVRCWWESVGMPTVLPHRGCARLVRKALRLEAE